MKPEIITGDLLDQKVDVIVNAWNRNLFPWWLLLPQGVSGAIKKRAGTAPFRELRKHGVLALGQAVMTGAGRLRYKGIIHVAGINHAWLPSERSVRMSVRNALSLAEESGIQSIAFPLIGSGTGGMSQAKVLELMTQEVESSGYGGKTVLVIFKR
jgi:O-acetyl-ADP-ribose deacetylase (regulator of RNase III)